MIRVAVVDDHPVARHGVISMLAQEQDIEVVAAVADPLALPEGEAGAVDVVVCDPFPFGETPSLQTVRAMAAQVAVLVVSASREAADVLAAMQAGARGYLTKHAGGEAYVTAIRCVAGGGSYLAAQLPDALNPPIRRDGGPLATQLSEREQQTLAYIARGFTHQQTATRMGISKATVDTYIGRIRTKLQLGNKAELAMAALRHVAPHHRELAALSR